MRRLVCLFLGHEAPETWWRSCCTRCGVPLEGEAVTPDGGLQACDLARRQKVAR
jgi:hypothetical protein